jgi:FlaA1/EpsC-like NDP-sugar epimerase
MKKNWEAIKKDFWVVLLDIVVVNISYLGALLLRFFVNFNLRPVAAEKYFPAWEHFTPWYTVLAIFVFIGFRLYGGLWRYAGINDMNRIIGASLVTSAIHVAGTCLFFTRMPITYYILGTIFQFIFVVIIRFSHRAVLVERRKIRSRRGNNPKCIVVGVGENGRKILKHIEEESVYKPVAVVGNGSGTMDGVPISSIDAVKWHEVDVVFIADPLLPIDERNRIKEKCGKNIEIQDYTGYFSNLGGRLSVTELLSVISGPVTLDINGVERIFSSGEEAIQSFTRQYDVKKLEGQIKVKLVDHQKTSTQDALNAAYAAVIGDEPLQGGSK